MKHTGGSGLTPGLEEALARLEERVRAMKGGALALRSQGGPASRLSDLAGYLEAGRFGRARRRALPPAGRRGPGHAGDAVRAVVCLF